MPPYFRCYFPESCKEVVLFYKSHDDLIPSGGGFFVVFCVAWLLTLWGFLGKNSTKWFVSPDGSACLHGLSKFDYWSGITELQGGAFTGGCCFSSLELQARDRIQGCSWNFQCALKGCSAIKSVGPVLNLSPQVPLCWLQCVRGMSLVTESCAAWVW